MNRHHWLGIGCSLLLAACIGDVGGSDSHGSGSVEIYSAAAIQRDLYNAGLARDDVEADPTPGGSGGVERGWTAEASSGVGRLVALQALWAQPFAQVAAGEPLLLALSAASGSAAPAVSAELEVIAPDGARSRLVEGFDLPEGSIADVYQETAPLAVAGTYSIRGQLIDSGGRVLSELPELQIVVATTRQVMASGLATVMSRAAKFRYSKGCSNRGCLVKRGSGDCWAMSDWIWANLQAHGYDARIIQYRTSASSRHRTVQYRSGGKWVDVPYSAYGVQKLFRATKSRPGLKVIAD